MENLKINAQRLWDTLMETARFGATPKGGIKRLALTDEDRKVRDWFKAAAEAVGCTVTVDEVGNMFARRPGRIAGLAPLCMGSHLDTQPTGGKFDGALGVLGALEAMRTLHEFQYETNAPIEIVNWTNEEGARFAPAMLASGVFAGVFTPDYAFAREDRDGRKFGDELDRIGYRGAEKAGGHALGAMFELHIEQGPILEDEDKMIGVVTGVQGMRWYEVTVVGQDAHTGATPMRLRKNALLGAARVIHAVDAIAHAFAPDAVGTVGLIENKPNSRNVIPGEVFFTIDLRHHDDAVLDKMETRMRAALPVILDSARPALRGEADLDVACGPLRAGAHRMRPARGDEGGLCDAGHRLRRRPRCRLCGAGRADHDDLRALPPRHQPQRGGIHDLRAMRGGGAGPARRGPGV